MEKRIIYQNQDGGVSVVIPSKEYLESHTIEELAAKDVPPNVEFEIINADDLPTDRLFRDAWVKNGASIEHDLTKAKKIAHELRRRARIAEFAPLDIEATIPSKSNEAESKRQKIRDKYADIQTNIDAGQTVNDIKTAMQFKY